VQFNGNLLVGKAYTAQLGLQPGDEFEIKLGRKQITLIPWGLPRRRELIAELAWLPVADLWMDSSPCFVSKGFGLLDSERRHQPADGPNSPSWQSRQQPEKRVAMPRGGAITESARQEAEFPGI